VIKTRRPLTCAALLIACALSLFASCSLKITKKAPTGAKTAHSAQDLAVKPNQIRLRMRSLVEPFAGEIEQSADTIVAGTSDRSVKRAAIQWKIEGVPAMRGTLFQPDPFTAVFDTWVLTNQMADYFESGPGRTALGPAAPLAVETSRRMEAELTQVATTFTISRDVSKVRATAKQWAIDHPIRYAIRDRETSLSRVTEQDAGVDWSAGEIIAEMATTADDLHREIQIYSNHLFRQARWEMELLKLDLPTEEVLPLAERAVKSSERAVASLDALTPSITTAANAASKAADAASNATSKLPPDIPALIASEREAAVEAINADLRQTLTFLQGERIAALRQISEERIAAMVQISAERVAIMKEVREIAANERLALGQDLEKASVKVVDHAAWRLAQIVAATLVSVLLSALFLLFLIRRLFNSPPNRAAGFDEPRPARSGDFAGSAPGRVQDRTA
jgi:hypothetical protein